MRTAYRERLEAFSQKQQVLADLAQTILEQATDALLTANLEKAESLVEKMDEVDALQIQGEEYAFAMLALEAPVARDLRQVVAGIHIVEDLVRMASLGIHVAKVTRRRHPDIAVPEPIRPLIAQMSTLGCHSTEMVKTILTTADADAALALHRDDDEVDAIHHQIFQLTTAREWEFSVQEAVDLTLLSRYLERYSDHAVNVGERVVFLATGMHHSEYRRSLNRNSDNDVYDALYGKYIRKGKTSD